MYRVNLKKNKEKRVLRVRGKVLGTHRRPRLSVFRSNKYTYAQLIDDEKGVTLLSISAALVRKLHKDKKKVEAAYELGKEIAKEAKSKKIKNVVFDRNGYKYHGRIRNVAEGAREGGLTL